MSFSRPQQPHQQFLARACPPPQPPVHWNQKPKQLQQSGPQWNGPAMQQQQTPNNFYPVSPVPQPAIWEQNHGYQRQQLHQYSPPPPPSSWTYEQQQYEFENGRFNNANGNGNSYFNNNSSNVSSSNNNYNRPIEYQNQIPWNPQLVRNAQAPMGPPNINMGPNHNNPMNQHNNPHTMCSNNNNMQRASPPQPLSPQIQMGHNNYSFPPAPTHQNHSPPPPLISHAQMAQVQQDMVPHSLDNNNFNVPEFLGRNPSVIATSDELAILTEIQRLLGWGSVIDLEYEVEVWRTCIASALGEKQRCQFQ